MSNVMITGGAGFIGANFAHYWQEHYPEDRLIIVDALTYAGCPSNLPHGKNVQFIKANITEQVKMEMVMRVEEVDTVVHFAAETHVDRSITAPDIFIESNIQGTYALLKAAIAQKHKVHFHHISTDEVYGSLPPGMKSSTEESAYAPNSPYAASKAASDHLVRAFNQTYGLSTTMSHCANCYGPMQFPEKLIPFFIKRALAGQTLPVYGDGSHVRDWLYVDDHCAAIDLIVKKGRSGEKYNISGRHSSDNLSLVKMLATCIDRLFQNNTSLAERFPDCPAAKDVETASLITHVKDRAGHDQCYAIDDAKIKNELGFSPTHEFSAALEKTVKWFFEKMTENSKEHQRVS